MGFHGARLVRVLARLAVPGARESRQSLAERLGDWLTVTDALALADTLGQTAPPGRVHTNGAGEVERAGEVDSHAGDRAAAAAVARVARDRVRLELANASTSFDTGATDFPSYRRHLQRMQREMSVRIMPLRQALRAEIAMHEPELGRLAALDAVFERALAERERSLLATVPVLLGRRFDQLRETSGGWLAVFHDDLRETLMAELELRLQPIDGLIAALDKDTTRKQ
jgi:hypothetical protein